MDLNSNRALLNKLLAVDKLLCAAVLFLNLNFGFALIGTLNSNPGFEFKTGIPRQSVDQCNFEFKTALLNSN